MKDDPRPRFVIRLMVDDTAANDPHIREYEWIGGTISEAVVKAADLASRLPDGHVRRIDVMYH